MILYGASGHAKVVKDIVEANGDTVSCFLDDNPNVNEVHGIKVLHDGKEIAEPLIVTIGDNATRKNIVGKLSVSYGKAVHPAAIVSPRAVVGEGSVVMQGAIVQADAEVGRHCIVNSGASIDHECRLDDFVHVSPHATLCGNVTVGEGTWIGAGATVIQGIRVGKWCVVGAGSVVTHDVPDYSLVAGSRPLTIKKAFYKSRHS